ncbi:MAG: outer membrane protein assembly factor BamA [Bdellovibrionia bacterium]
MIQLIRVCLALAVLTLSLNTSAQSKKNRKATPPNNAQEVTEAAPASGVINEIVIEGNRKIENDAILEKIKTKKGDSINTKSIRDDILELFRTGFFLNVEVEKRKVGASTQLVYKVKEKASISEIIYEGNSEIKEDDIAEASGLKVYQILDMAKINEAKEKVQKLYEEKGFFLAKVDIQVEEVVPGEAAKIIFKVDENDKVKVQKITFIGNKHIPSRELKTRMLTQEGGFFSGISGSGQYKQEMFERDVQILRFVYYNKGYVQAKVDRPQVYVTPDKKSIYITIRIEEGEQYYVGSVDFGGDLLFSRSELEEVIEIDTNEVFAYDVLQKDISNLTAKYGDLGYAYANVIPRTEFNDRDRKVNLFFEFDKGDMVYFGKINVVGNSKTRDKVVRRELKIREGELYNETRRRESLENVQRLGFFEEVNFKTSVDPERNHIMNVDIVVRERSTGQIQLGAGFGSSTGFTLQGSVNQINFLGKGQNLGANLNLSGTGNFFRLSFTEPYYRDTLWSVGYDVYQSSNTGRIDYDEEHMGGGVRFGHPVGENIRGFFQFKYDKTTLKERFDSNNVSITDKELFPLETASGETGTIGASLEYDTRNDRMSPSKGILASIGYEYSGLSQLKYYTASANVRYFKNLFWDVVWRNSLTYGQIGSLESGRPVPFSELYLLGGPYSLRGYRIYRIGKRKFSNKIYNELVADLGDAEARKRAMRSFGGTQKAMYQTELQFPLIKEAGIMGVAFYDIGAAEDELQAADFFADVGFGIRWFSPIGPLRFEWGFPLNRDPDYHEPTVFEFSIGVPF